MHQLRPISTPSLPTRRAKSTEPKSVGKLHALPSPSTLATPSPARLSTLPPPPSSTHRVLDFDVETVAAGYADPQWVPHTVTAWAYAWVDGDVVVDALPPAYFYDLAARRDFMQPLLVAIGQADVLTGHNIVRFDLPVVNAECLRLNLKPLAGKLVQDTIRLPKSKGFKKGQDNLGHVFGVREEKLPLSWAEWAAAYAEPDLATVKERCASDVRMHVALRAAMLERGVLGAPRPWRP